MPESVPSRRPFRVSIGRKDVNRVLNRSIDASQTRACVCADSERGRDSETRLILNGFPWSWEGRSRGVGIPEPKRKDVGERGSPGQRDRFFWARFDRTRPSCPSYPLPACTCPLLHSFPPRFLISRLRHARPPPFSLPRRLSLSLPSTPPPSLVPTSIK